jgi:hypothetical protein
MCEPEAVTNIGLGAVITLALACAEMGGVDRSRASTGETMVGEVSADLGDPLDSEHWFGVGVDLTHDILRVPREPNLTIRITSAEQAHHLSC